MDRGGIEETNAELFATQSSSSLNTKSSPAQDLTTGDKSTKLDCSSFDAEYFYKLNQVYMRLCFTRS